MNQQPKPKDPIRVLVVDDEERVLQTVEAVLSEHVEVVTTSSISEALALNERSTFHVICADYRMPMMNGLELLQKLSARSPYVSCLLLTGAEEYFAKADKSGYYVLMKPFSPERLIAIILQLGRVAQMKRTVTTPFHSPTGRFRPTR
jgi:DNA-binding NtrC family response regulator